MIGTAIETKIGLNFSKVLFKPQHKTQDALTKDVHVTLKKSHVGHVINKATILTIARRKTKMKRSQKTRKGAISDTRN